MYRLLIVDDEPLVQIGLKTMLSKEHSNDIEIIATASNGKEAWEIIEKEKPDIVIADIRMPVMTGLELLQKSYEKFGNNPAFIILTAYEEFDMVREALSGDAVDYLVKIELTPKTLNAALSKAIKRIEGSAPVPKRANVGATSSLDDLRQKFLLRLIFNSSHLGEDDIKKEAKELGVDLEFKKYTVVYGEIAVDDTQGEASTDTLDIYTSSLNMAKEILSKYNNQCRVVSVDLRHFVVVFFFAENTDVSTTMDEISDALENAGKMVAGYFKSAITFGIGSAVSKVTDISVSCDEAMTALSSSDEETPISRYDIIVGNNRRSGKDKLIQTIQEYIDDNLNGRVQLNEVAEAFGLSPAYLSVLFKKAMETGFSEYVYTKKIEKAKEMLLSGDMKIYEVADALGFESAYYFSKVFKKVDGHSPREYIRSKSDI
ncbi:response regulator [Butyrivibrio sp. XB500-5]|uniref:response regulator n=1 Tax=Butyrivibrio sp. XB500-5 TaxID=2364880 RepID=UPI000EA9CCD9|nr:response regulator [Butyrivibrio sp. XB500-5]RKM57771.1 response regulator [Butyrivibrio sp. XB500-5]